MGEVAEKKLSIITICYNEPNLEKTCESIVNQTCQDFEWVVIDGGSNQATLDVFEKYKYRIDKFVSEKDDGIYNACNKGIRLAGGEYLIFMNAGDYFYDKDVIKLYYCFTEGNVADVYYGTCRTCMNDKSINVLNYPSVLTKEYFLVENICTQGVFISKKLFENFGMYNENYKIVSDYEKWLQFLLAGVVFQRLPIIVANYDLNGVSGNEKTRQLSLSERSKVIDKFYTMEEIMVAEKLHKKKYNLLSKIFSITNSITHTYKIITVLGVHIKIKKKRR